MLMKGHRINTEHYQKLETDFKEWLQTLGYSKHTVYYKPLFLREFLHYLEQQEIFTHEKITENTIPDYIEQLKQRKKQRATGILSGVSINNHIHTLEKLAEYLLKQKGKILAVNVKRQESQSKKIVFTREEIKSLYECCDSSPLGMRDTAMLDIYYGCGLRRSEAEALLINDLQLEKGLLFVRKGKAYKERLVPVANALQLRLSSYLEYARPILLKGKSSEHFFINEKRGVNLSSGGLYQRLKKLLKLSGIYERKPQAGLHTLRHSIATHLLQSGMSLEDISKFLGHSSLESTQIYTHIINELEG
jgi:integrase/recombinase XerD